MGRELSFFPFPDNPYRILGVIEIDTLLFFSPCSWLGEGLSAQPKHPFDKRNQQRTDSKDQNSHYNHVGNALLDVVAQKNRQVHVTHNQWVVPDIVNHAVLPYIAYTRYAPYVCSQEDTRQSRQRQHRINHHSPEWSYKGIGFHFVFTMQVDVHAYEGGSQYDTYRQPFPVSHLVQHDVPDFSQEEEEGTAEYIVHHKI